MDIPKYGLLILSTPLTRSKVTHQTPHNDLINAIFCFFLSMSIHPEGDLWHVSPLTTPQSSSAFVMLSLNMCHFHCCTVSPACLDKCQFEVLLVRRNYGFTYHAGEKPEVFLFTHTSFKRLVFHQSKCSGLQEIQVSWNSSCDLKRELWGFKGVGKGYGSPVKICARGKR